MKLRNKLLALALATIMAASLAACGSKSSTDSEETKAPAQTSAPEETKAPEETEGEKTASNTPLVIASDDFSEKFSEFFANSVPDVNVADMTAVALLQNDRAGEMIYNGIKGETKTWNGKDYTYTGIADCVVTENADGTVDYEFTLRDDILFSDGEKMTADDIIFSYYVYCDPSYDGATSVYSLPIKCSEAYRSGSETLFNLLV